MGSIDQGHLRPQSLDAPDSNWSPFTPPTRLPWSLSKFSLFLTRRPSYYRITLHQTTAHAHLVFSAPVAYNNASLTNKTPHLPHTRLNHWVVGTAFSCAEHWLSFQRHLRRTRNFRLLYSALALGRHQSINQSIVAHSLQRWTDNGNRAECPCRPTERSRQRPRPILLLI